jgi:hypothetical protein
MDASVSGNFGMRRQEYKRRGSARPIDRNAVFLPNGGWGFVLRLPQKWPLVF